MVTSSITRPDKPSANPAGIGLVSACVLAALLATLAVPRLALAQNGIECRPDPSLGEAPNTLPVDVCGQIQARSKDFQSLSWQLFRYLVWPASPSIRGQPDTSKAITSMEGPRTFETLKSDWEVFLLNAARPAAWNEYPGTATPCRNRPGRRPGELVLASFNEFGNLSTGDPGIGHVLVAQNRTYVRYQAAFSDKVFRKIVESGLYDATVVSRIPPAPSGTLIREDVRQDDGALTVKSAWIELPAERGESAVFIDPSRFHVRDDAWVQHPETLDCRRARVGLVGLHIVYKTPSRPQWIWATFEHVDNVPDMNSPRGRSYTFYNGDLGTPMTDDPEPDFVIPRRVGVAGPGDPPRPFQVQRLQQIEQDVVDANELWQAKFASIGSVWKNYKLIMTQWPGFPFAPRQGVERADPQYDCALRGDRATANTTMETFQQTQEQCVQALTCMGCHNMARNVDFVWALKMNPFKSPAADAPSSRAGAIRSLQEVLRNKHRR